MISRIVFQRVRREPFKGDYVAFYDLETEDITVGEFYKVINTGGIFRDDVGDIRATSSVIKPKGLPARYEVFERIDMEVEDI